MLVSHGIIFKVIIGANWPVHQKAHAYISASVDQDVLQRPLNLLVQILVAPPKILKMASNSTIGTFWHLNAFFWTCWAKWLVVDRNTDGQAVRYCHSNSWSKVKYLTSWAVFWATQVVSIFRLLPLLTLEGTICLPSLSLSVRPSVCPLKSITWDNSKLFKLASWNLVYDKVAIGLLWTSIISPWQKHYINLLW